MIIKKRAYLTAAIVLAAVMRLGMLDARAADQAIGALFPMSGTNAAEGEVFTNGANLAIEHVNADKMLSGKLSIRYEDTQAQPQTGVIGMTKLVNVDKLPYVMSAYTGVSKAVSTLCQRYETVCINGGAIGPDLAKLGSYFWNIIPLANLEIRAVETYLAGTMKLKRLALIYVDDPLGQAVLNELQSNMPKVGGEVVDSFSVPPDSQQFSGIAAKIRNDKADVVYIASYGAQQLQIIKQLRDNGITAQFVTYSGNGGPVAVALPEAEGMIFTSQRVDFNAGDAVTKRYVTDFKAKYGKNPTPIGTNYYNAVRLYALLAQSLEKKGQAITGPSLLAERNAIGSFDVVGGRISFQPDGTVLAPIQINVIKNKSVDILATIDVSR